MGELEPCESCGTQVSSEIKWAASDLVDGCREQRWFLEGPTSLGYAAEGDHVPDLLQGRVFGRLPHTPERCREVRASAGR